MKALTLNQKLRMIGCTFDEDLPENHREYLVDIEKTLAEVLTSIQNMTESHRLVTIIFTWIEIHGWCLNSAKFLKVIDRGEFKGANFSYIGLASVFAVSLKLRNWNSLVKKFEPTADRTFRNLSDEAVLFYNGPEKWAEAFRFQIPKDSLRTNPKWVLSRRALAELNLQYRNRLIYGSDWRSDVVTAIQFGADRPATIVKWIGISYEPAYRIFEDLKDAGFVEQHQNKKVIV